MSAGGDEMKGAFWPAIGAAVLAGLVWAIGPAAVLGALRAAPPWTLPALAALHIGSLCLTTLGLSALLPPIPLFDLLARVSRSALLSILGPTATNEGSLLTLLARAGIPAAAAARAILLDRGVAALTVLVAAAVALGRLEWVGPAAAAALAASVIGAGIVAVLLVARAEAAGILLAAGASLVRSLLWGIYYLVAFRAAGVRAGSYVDFVAIPIAVRILAFIPVPGGVGVTEAGAAAAFSVLGVDPAAAVGAYLLARLGAFLGTALVAALPLRGVASRPLWDGLAGAYADRTTRPEIPRTMLDALRDGIILDVGCGSGSALAELRSRARRVVAIDVSRALLKRVPAGPGVLLVQADAARLPLRSGACGAVHSYLAFSHMPGPDLPRAWSEVSRVLAPGGRLLLGAANRRSFYFPLRKAVEMAGAYSLGWCHHASPRGAACDGARVGLRLVEARALLKPPIGSTRLRRAVARAAAAFDERFARFLPGWGGDLVLLFEKPPENRG